MDNRPLSKLACWIVRVWLYTPMIALTIYGLVNVLKGWSQLAWSQQNWFGLAEDVFVVYLFGSAISRYEKEGLTTGMVVRNLIVSLVLTGIFFLVCIPAFLKHETSPALLGLPLIAIGFVFGPLMVSFCYGLYYNRTPAIVRIMQSASEKPAKPD